MKILTHTFVPVCLTSLLGLTGCAMTGTHQTSGNALIKEAMKGTEAPVPEASKSEVSDGKGGTVKANAVVVPRQQILRGGSDFVNTTANVKPDAKPDSGEIVLNFSDQPIKAVINTVLGDLLKVNYTVSPGVSGNVSFSTARPISRNEALSVLQTLLSWNGNALIKQGDKYEVLPASKAVSGQLVPKLVLPAPQAGFSVRLFPLKYISASEMQKLLKPYAKANSILQVDNARNMLALAGSQAELDNYQQTIDTFDVNWLKGMSIGVFALEHASVSQLIPQLKSVFGEKSQSPMAGMVKFMPVQRTNSVVVISPQADYLSDIGRWIHTIDAGGGNEPQLYVYDVLNMKAEDLAQYLKDIYGGSRDTSESSAEVAPGLTPQSLSSFTDNSDDSMSSSSSSTLGGTGSLDTSGSAGLSMNDSDATDSSTASSNGSAAGTLSNGIRITAQKSSNQLIVRARPSQWQEIESAVHRLDKAPRQVQVETRILEVNLSGELSKGVQWYLGHLAGNSDTDDIENTSGSQGALGSGGASLSSSDTMFYSFVGKHLQVALHALETSSRTQVLSAPSLVVMNNQKAQIQVGDDVPISQTSINTSDSDDTVSSVEYVQTGVILDVVPRINPNGRVYMEIKQQVSDAESTDSDDENPTISTRSVSTQIGVQSGQTVLLGGLISANNSNTDSRVPWLSRLPGIGWFFRNRTKSNDRTELIVLITPRVINDNSEARMITNDYKQQMQLMQPQPAKDNGTPST